MMAATARARAAAMGVLNDPSFRLTVA